MSETCWCRLLGVGWQEMGRILHLCSPIQPVWRNRTLQKSTDMCRPDGRSTCCQRRRINPTTRPPHKWRNIAYHKRGPTRTTTPSIPKWFVHPRNVHADPLGKHPIHGHACSSPSARFHLHEGAIQPNATAELPAQKSRCPAVHEVCNKSVPTPRLTEQTMDPEGAQVKTRACPRIAC